MQYASIGTTDISRFGIGTKRLPTTDVSRVERIDTARSYDIVQAALSEGVSFMSTSYSDRKGEAESFYGDDLAQLENRPFIATSYFELVDPRFEYVFQKQMKKLKTDCIDFYFLEGVCDLTRMRDIDSGAVDFLFAQKEAGKIAHLGFSSELNAENLQDYLKRYPWDFVRLRLNFFDWFMKGAREQYETASEAGLPIVAHGALRVGPRDHLKPEAREVLRAANAERSTIDWSLRFVKGLENVRVLTCNVSSEDQLREDVAVFQDDEVLEEVEVQALAEAANKQKTTFGHSK